MNISDTQLKDLAKKACHSLWINKDYFKFKQYCTSDVDIIGFSDSDTIKDGNFDGVNFLPFLHNTSITYEIIHETYKTSAITDCAGIVICELSLSETKGEFKHYIHVYTTFVFGEPNGEALIFNAHFSSPDVIGFNSNNKILSDTDAELANNYHNNETDNSQYYKNLLESNCDLLVEMDPKKYELTYNVDKYHALFDDNTNYANPDRWFWHMCNTCVHPDDCERVDVFRKVDIEKRIRNNIDRIETTFRIRNSSVGYIWVKMQVLYKYKDNQIQHMTIVFNKLDSKHFDEVEFIEKSRRDDLTGVYNKSYGEYLINTYIENYNHSQTCAFMITDIDNFRQVNDTFGHITGDNILIQFSRSLNSFFGNGEIIGRFSGDKFFVLISTMPSQYEVTKSVDNFLKNMHHTHCELGTSLDIHCSAGIVFLGNDVETFDSLYNKGFEALLKAKSKGKNCYNIG